MWFKIGLLGLVCILMIAINAGGTSFFPETITALILTFQSGGGARQESYRASRFNFASMGCN